MAKLVKTKRSINMQHELPIRKHPRLKDSIYSQDDAYFVTICVKGKQALLGPDVGRGILDAPLAEQSAQGGASGKPRPTNATIPKNGEAPLTILTCTPCTVPWDFSFCADNVRKSTALHPTACATKQMLFSKA